MLLHFLFRTFHHAFDHNFRIGIEFSEFLFETLGISTRIDLVSVIFFLDLTQIDGVKISG